VKGSNCNIVQNTIAEFPLGGMEKGKRKTLVRLAIYSISIQNLSNMLVNLVSQKMRELQDISRNVKMDQKL